MSHYLKYVSAPFQKEMTHLAEDLRHRMIVVMAFRGSGKSTILNTAYSLWAVLGDQRKKFVLIVSNTQAQAKAHFTNIKHELETNELLAHDLGPFKTNEDDWGSYSLQLDKHGAKIMCVSQKQSIRGLRHGQHRPDLIICDDIEGTGYSENEGQVDNVYDWFMSEVLPLGNEKTRIIVLGNLLGSESLLVKLKEYARTNPKTAIFKAYPLIDYNGKCLWPQKFNEESCEHLEDILSLDVWGSEYLLVLYPSGPVRFIIMDFGPLDENGEYPRYPKEPEVDLQEPTIDIMKKFLIKAPIIY